MARKLPRFQRVLSPRDLFSVAYGEIAASIYFALGIIAAYALGFTPLVLVFAGALFLLVAASYAEGTTSVPETGGAATLGRRAFNDLIGFVTGWALFLDYVIVAALACLFVPHYVGGAFEIDALREGPWDTVAGVAIVLAIGAVRLLRRPSLYRFGIMLAVLDIAGQLLLIGLGLVLLFSPEALTSGTDLGVMPTWGQIGFVIPVAMLAYTGLETVANLAEESRDLRALPRSLFSAIGAVVLVYVLIAIVGVSAFPVEDGSTALGEDWLEAPLVGIATQIGTHLPELFADLLRISVGIVGATILLLAATTSISGFSRLAYSLGEHRMLPATYGRLHHRTLVAPASIASAALISAALLIGTSVLEDPVTFLASLFSFGLLLAFTVAQLSVLKLRLSDPDRPRPFRIPLNVSIAGHALPVPAIVGALLTTSIFVLSMVTHEAARYGGPLWLVAGLVVYGLVRRGRAGLFENVTSSDEQELPEARFSRILVPMKLGDIGEEMLATAIRLAQEGAASVIALNVMEVPMERELDDPTAETSERSRASLEEARTLGQDEGVPVEEVTVLARSIGSAIVEQAAEQKADLIVLGSSPRWRKQSRFFSPTVEYVLRKAPCEVMIVAFPEGVLDQGNDEE